MPAEHNPQLDEFNPDDTLWVCAHGRLKDDPAHLRACREMKADSLPDYGDTEDGD